MKFIKVMVVLVGFASSIDASNQLLRAKISECVGIRSCQMIDQSAIDRLLTSDMRTFSATLRAWKAEGACLPQTAIEDLQPRLLELTGGRYDNPELASLSELIQSMATRPARPVVDEPAGPAPVEEPRRPVAPVGVSFVDWNVLNDDDYSNVSSNAPATVVMDLPTRQRMFGQVMQGALAQKDIYCFQEWDNKLLALEGLLPASYRIYRDTIQDTQLLFAFNAAKFTEVQPPLFSRFTHYAVDQGHYGYGVIVLKEQSTGKQIGIVNTHFEGRPIKPTAVGEPRKADIMLQEIIGTMQTDAYRSIENWIVAGDFNIHMYKKDDTRNDGYGVFTDNYFIRWRLCNDSQKSVRVGHPGLASGADMSDVVTCLNPYFNSFNKKKGFDNTDYVFIKGPDLTFNKTAFYPQSLNVLLAHDDRFSLIPAPALSQADNQLAHQILTYSSYQTRFGSTSSQLTTQTPGPDNLKLFPSDHRAIIVDLTLL